MRGHSMKGRRRLDLERGDANRTSKHETARIRARRETECALTKIGGCGGRLEVHHIDENPWNNEQGNLMKLCRCHHLLIHKGRIDLSHPVMPGFFISSGKRRYL